MRGRRAADKIYPIVDWHSPRVLFLALAILVFCVADGVFTVILMTKGAVEANPLMALCLRWSLGWFAGVKLALTTGCLLVLVACSPMRLLRKIPGELLLYFVLSCYIALIVHETRLMHSLDIGL